MLVECRYIGLYTLKNMGLQDQVQILSPAINNPALYVAFSKKKNLQPVVSDFNKALAELKGSSDYEKIINKYLQ